MKKYAIALFTLAIFASASAASNKSNIDVKLGAAHAKAAGKFGFDSSLGYNYGLDQYLTLGFSAGFTFWNFDSVTGTTTTATGTVNTITSASVQHFPMMATAVMRFPLDYGLTPYFQGGFGYGIANSVVSGISSNYKGIIFEGLFGIAYNLGGGGDDDWGGGRSPVNLIVEAGYRGAAINNSSNAQIDLSGFVVHAGVRYDL